MPENININRQQHNITISEPMRDYHLPIASATVLGGVKIGNNLTIEEDGTLNAESTEYTLPTASASVLGGIKVGSNLSINDGVLTSNVDSNLSTASSATNPVQNKVVSSAISALENTTNTLDDRLDTVEGNYSTLSNTVAGIGSDITSIQSSISDLSSDVSANTSAIGTNTTAIDTNASAITALGNRVTSAEGTITDQGNAINEMAGEIDDFTLQSDTDVEYSYLLPVNTWSQGKIVYSRRGKNGLITFDIDGNMSLAANTETQIYQIPDTFQNSIICKGILNTNVGPLTVTMDNNRNITFTNITASAMNQITKVRGQLVVVLE